MHTSIAYACMCTHFPYEHAETILSKILSTLTFYEMKILDRYFTWGNTEWLNIKTFTNSIFCIIG